MKTVRLTSKYLNKGKLQSIKDIDVKITVLKNSMSNFVYTHLKELVVLGNLGFTTKYYKQFNNTDITNWETQKLFNMICIMYLKKNMYRKDHSKSFLLY